MRVVRGLSFNRRAAESTNRGMQCAGICFKTAGQKKMTALVYLGPGKKALEERPKPNLMAPTDAIVKISKTTICGTDLHILKGDVPTCVPGRILGHEGVGIIDSAGSTRPLRPIVAEEHCL